MLMGRKVECNQLDHGFAKQGQDLASSVAGSSFLLPLQARLVFLQPKPHQTLSNARASRA